MALYSNAAMVLVSGLAGDQVVYFVDAKRGTSTVGKINGIMLGGTHHKSCCRFSYCSLTSRSRRNLTGVES